MRLCATLLNLRPGRISPAALVTQTEAILGQSVSITDRLRPIPSQLRPNLVNSVARLADSSPNLADLGRVRAEVGQTRPELGGPSLANVGRNRPRSVQVWAKVGRRIWPIPTHVWPMLAGAAPNLGEVRQILTEVGLNLASAGRCRPKLGYIWAKFDCSPPNVGQPLPERGQT